MAVSSSGIGDGEFFTSLGMLIIQGRKWDAFRKTRGRGLHCPTVRNSSPPHHQCSVGNVECQTALSFRHAIQAIWEIRGVVIIEVILLPECGHSEPALLLERWTLQVTDETTEMTKLSLMQAIDSTIHFSQLCSWWSSTNGMQPRNVQYKVYERRNNNELPLQFPVVPLRHQFMVSCGVNVHLESLPRRSAIPELHCRSCLSFGRQTSDSSVCQNRGRSFFHQRHGSRHSSASSDSHSPSVSSRVDGKSPLGSPLLSFRVTLSSSSSSQGSSRATSPCISRSPSERNVAGNFLSSEALEIKIDEQHTDSGIMDSTPIENCTIDQDEELANQLDSLSDSDLSDDYVIDGPVGSPGLIGTPIASPDDSRVQMLQSTFAGFHCRHPAFDRLMGESFGNGEIRTRHSSLDSAVSNLERLDLETRRRLSRTSSDSQKFEKLRQACAKNSNDKEFFIRDHKKRHKIASFDDADSMFDSAQATSDSFNNTFYASFQTDPKSEYTDSEMTPILDFCHPSDDFSTRCHNDLKILLPPFNSTPSTVGFVMLQHPSETAEGVSPIDDHLSLPKRLNDIENSTSKHRTSKRLCSDRFPSLHRSQSVDSAKLSYSLQNLDDTPFSQPRLKKLRSRNLIMLDESQSSVVPSCQQAKKRDASPNAVSKELKINNPKKDADEFNENKLKHDPQDLKDNQSLDSNCNSSSTLLRSPPSKLRILPSHCVEKNYECNPTREVVHKLSSQVATCSAARVLQFNPPSEKSVCTSPAPIRRNNSVRFEFDEDMPNINQRSSRSSCRGKCMKQSGIIVHNHTHLAQTHRLLGSFEESIVHNRLEVLGSVDGFHAQLGASGSFCPPKRKLPVIVRFFHVSDDNAPSPYMGTMSLKGKECGKRGYHIPRKGTIQLTLFNPNNSVVKVFVILYDVSDMPPGHRTFLRHRIYSKPINDGDNKTDVKVPNNKSQDSSKEVNKSTILHQNQPSSKLLRYFVHLWLESSKTNKIYIHGDVKILFSPALSEWDSGNTFELQTETEFPKDPRYSSKR